MKLNDIFKKSIERDIKGVIKVGQREEEDIKQELEEYVVTNELQKYFRDFFSAYNKSINSNTDDMGVWISGFFGSGKSHLLKILSYLLSNREIDGKKAIEYFIEDQKIKDEMVLADMKRACRTSTDSILFNIDSKSDSIGNKGKDEILKVFLKVFNEMQGFSSNPHVADLEKELVEANKYDEFKEEYKKLTDKEWIEDRNKFKFIISKVIEVTNKIKFLDENEMKHWVEQTKKDYTISIEEFAKNVNKYITSKGNDHHVIFFVDEIGQYIGENTDLMLNLQTVTEDLGIHCKGKAWVVVTSQQAIDSITKVKGNDFSKIQGRFNTRISLTSTDVSEVIKKRILYKNEYGKQALSLAYDEKESIIKNLIIFNDGVDKKLYENKIDFEEVYPFIPYQFHILSKVLNSIREHGASGKHLSEGERSMLAMFKESAEKYKNDEIGVLVSFDKFYDGLESFLDHTHSIVITGALKNNFINHTKEEDNFNVNVLKVLFMIKYVKEIKPTLENITTLMVDKIDTDRISLKEKVKKALDLLISQTLIQKNGDYYIFLTNEEQEVEKIIDRISIDSNKIISRIGEEIFDSLYSMNKYSYPYKKEYSFSFNRKIDGISKGKDNFDIGIHIITLNSDFNRNESGLLMRSTQENSVFVDLSENIPYLQEIEKDLKIEEFLTSGELENLPQKAVIIEKKREERKEYRERSKRLLIESLMNADYYINGNKSTISSKDYQKAILEALEKLVSTVFDKLNCITNPMSEIDIKNIFVNDKNQILSVEKIDHNKNARIELIDYLKIAKNKVNKLNLRAIKEKFSKAPYGFMYKDIEWIIAKSFKDGEIAIFKDNNSITLLNETSDRIIDLIIKKENLETVYLELKEEIDPKSIKIMNDVSSILFEKYLNSDDVDKMIRDFKDLVKTKIAELEKYRNDCNTNGYPGLEILDKGLKLIIEIDRLSDIKEIFECILKNKDNYEDFIEDYEQIKIFFNGAQKEIWQDSTTKMKIFEDSKNFFSNEDIENVKKEIQSILNNKIPYKEIKNLVNLNKIFEDNYNEILDKERDPIKNKIEQFKERVLQSIGDDEYLKDKFMNEMLDGFSEILEKNEKSKNIKDIRSFGIEAESLREKLLNKIDVEREKMEVAIDGVAEGPTEINKLAKTKRISISKINNDSYWEIKSEYDINKYIEKLRLKLKEELEGNEILKLEF